MDQQASSPARDRIIAAAIELAAADGWDRVSYTAVAGSAGVSRQTLYTQFPSRDDLYDQVIEVAASQIIDQVIAQARNTKTGADFVLEIMVSCIVEFRENPVTSTVGLVRPDGVLGPEAVEIGMAFLEPLLEREPHLADDFEEIAETMIRFLLSIVAFDSARTRTPRQLRAYLRRRLLPALGLEG